MKTISQIKKEWQIHNRNNGLSWNEVSQLVDEVVDCMREPSQDQVGTKISGKCLSQMGDYRCHVTTNLRDSKNRPIYVDKCMKGIVEMLNSNGYKTVMSCCGHDQTYPIIIVEVWDRELDPERDQAGTKMSVEKFIEHRYSSRFGDKWDRVAKQFDYYDMTDFAEAYIDYLNE